MELQQNVGETDRFLRIGMGGFLLALSAARMARYGVLGGAATGVLGGMMLAEGVLGHCPYYSLLGIDTRSLYEEEPGEGRDFYRAGEGI